MKFAQWFAEMDQQLPDAMQFSYIACVLDLMSQDNLEAFAKKWSFEKLGHGIASDWTYRAHHMTVLFRQGGILIEDLESYKQFFGEDVKLAVTGIAADDNCIAVTVKPKSSFPMKSTPHITVAHSRAVSPVYSNTLLMDCNKIYAVDSIELNSVFAAVKKHQKSIWPEKSFPLALPTKIY